MIEFVWLVPAAFCVGVLIGAVGIGGILLIPVLTAFAGLGIHESMATALFTFAFTGITGTIMFQRRGSIDWRVTTPVCLGTVLFAFAGAWANALTAPAALAAILAGIIIFAGVYTLATWHGLRQPAFSGSHRAQQAVLVMVGAVSGFGSGLTGEIGRAHV